MRVLNEQKLLEMEAYIKSYVHDNNGESPSLMKIMDEMGMVKSVAYRYMLALKERGRIEYDGKHSLSLSNGKDNYTKCFSVCQQEK